MSDHEPPQDDSRLAERDYKRLRGPREGWRRVSIEDVRNMSTFLDWVVGASRRTMFATILVLATFSGWSGHAMWIDRNKDIKDLQEAQRRADWDSRYELQARVSRIEEWRDRLEAARAEQRLEDRETLKEIRADMKETKSQVRLLFARFQRGN